MTADALETEVVDVATNATNEATNATNETVIDAATDDTSAEKCTTPLECFRLFVARCAAALTALLYASRALLLARVAALVRGISWLRVLIVSNALLVSKGLVAKVIITSKLAALKVPLLVKALPTFLASKALGTRVALATYSGSLLRFLLGLLLGLYHHVWLPTARWLVGLRGADGVEAPPPPDDEHDGGGGQGGWAQRLRLRSLALVGAGILLDRAVVTSRSDLTAALVRSDLSAARALEGGVAAPKMPTLAPRFVLSGAQLRHGKRVW